MSRFGFRKFQAPRKAAHIRLPCLFMAKKAHKRFFWVTVQFTNIMNQGSQAQIGKTGSPFANGCPEVG